MCMQKRQVGSDGTAELASLWWPYGTPAPWRGHKLHYFPAEMMPSEGECITQKALPNISFWKHYQPLPCRFVSFPLPAIRELQGQGAVLLRSKFTHPAPFCSELRYSHTSKGKVLRDYSLPCATPRVKHTPCFPTGKCSL